MKKLTLTLFLVALTTGAFAQGLVNFVNQTATANSFDGTLASGANYVYSLFVAPVGTTDRNSFTWTGIMATNLNVGRINTRNNLQVAGWAAGETRAFYVAGWSLSYGTDWNVVKGYVDANMAPVAGGYGASLIAPGGVAGGGLPDGSSLPNLNLFGGSQGISAGFNMTTIPVPEPSSFALAGLGAAALFIFRRRK